MIPKQFFRNQRYEVPPRAFEAVGIFSVLIYVGRSRHRTELQFDVPFFNLSFIFQFDSLGIQYFFLSTAVCCIRSSLGSTTPNTMGSKTRKHLKYFTYRCPKKCIHITTWNINLVSHVPTSHLCHKANGEYF